ncbi:MAG: Hsp20 family protein [Chloroflexota bacterium]
MKRRFIRWEPPTDIVSLREAMDRLVEESFIRTPQRIVAPILRPELSLDLYETDQAIIVRAALPGVKSEDLDISITGQTLTIKGETKPDPEIKKEQYLRQEMRYGEFSRSVTLPRSLEPDQAQAGFEDGILTLTIPKAEDVRPKIIRVRTE